MNSPQELLKRVRALEIKTKKFMNTAFMGAYSSHFKGQGMTFADFREYVPGDDVRSMAWQLTARTGKTYVKTYEEERELNVVLAVDVSGSQDFGSASTKMDLAALAAAILGFSAVQHNDPVGLVLFSDVIEHWVPPKKGRSQMLRLMRDLCWQSAELRRTEWTPLLNHLLGVLKKRSMIFIVSDFVGPTFPSSLGLLAQRHEVVAIGIGDRLESELPAVGLIDMVDPESGDVVTVDTTATWFRRVYEQMIRERDDQMRAELMRLRIPWVKLSTASDVYRELLRFFQKGPRR